MSCDEAADVVEPSPTFSFNGTIPASINYDESITISANVIAKANIESIVLSLSGSPNPLFTKESGFTNTDSDEFSYTFTSNSLTDIGKTLTFELAVTDKKGLETMKAVNVAINAAQISINFFDDLTADTPSDIDSIGTVGDIVNHDFKVESNIGLTNFKVDRISENGEITGDIANYTVFEGTDEKEFIFNFDQVLKDSYYLVKATDKSGFEFSRKFWVSPPLGEDTDVSFGAQESQTGSFLAFVDGDPVLSQSEATANQESVVMMYYVDGTDGVTFASPNDPSETNFFADVIVDWTTRNKTFFKKAADPTIFDSDMNYLQMKRAYLNEEAEEIEKISGFVEGDVVFFRTNLPDGDEEIERIIMMKITALTTTTNGTVTISAKFEGEVEVAVEEEEVIEVQLE
jgi:hypothetical protein